MSKKENLKTVITPQKEDYRYAIRKGSVSVIPFVGQLMGEVYSVLSPSPYQERLYNFLKILDEQIKMLKKAREINLPALAKNKEFQTIIARATRVAMFEHQKEKIEMLKNIVLNTAIGIDIEEDEKMMFLNLVETIITPSHLKILLFIKNDALKPKAEQRKIMEKEWKLFGNIEIMKKIIRDLYSQELITSGEIQEMHTIGFHGQESFTVPTLAANGITPTGENFVRFISRNAK